MFEFNSSTFNCLSRSATPNLSFDTGFRISFCSFLVFTVNLVTFLIGSTFISCNLQVKLGVLKLMKNKRPNLF